MTTIEEDLEALLSELEAMEDADRIGFLTTLAPAERMSLSMSCDHRVIDGATGARFLDTLVDLLEKPESLAL